MIRLNKVADPITEKPISTTRSQNEGADPTTGASFRPVPLASHSNSFLAYSVPASLFRGRYRCAAKHNPWSMGLLAAQESAKRLTQYPATRVISAGDLRSASRQATASKESGRCRAFEGMLGLRPSQFRAGLPR